MGKIPLASEYFRLAGKQILLCEARFVLNILVTEHAYFHQKSELLLLDTNVWVNVPASSFLKGKTDQYMEGDIEIALFLKKMLWILLK